MTDAEATATTSPPAVRPTCPRCARPLAGCLCRWITPTANRVSLLVLQHPMEVGQAKGSARLLQLSLRCCQVEVGETFDARALAGWLQAPTAAGPAHNLLLYPSSPSSPSSSSLVATMTRPGSAAAAVRLVLLDGTWRKTRKMLALNPLLQALPRWALAAPPPSRYTIRQAQAPDQRSTLEAACLALGELESHAGHYAPLLAAFDGWVAAHGALAQRRRKL